MGKTELDEYYYRLGADRIVSGFASERSWLEYDQEDYIYSKEVKIRQRKKLFGYEDMSLTDSERGELANSRRLMDNYKAFCEQYGIKYTENSSSDVSIESEKVYSRKMQYKVETFNNSIEFSISRPIMEEIVRGKSNESYKNTMDVLKQESGEWYDIFAHSDALNIVVDKVTEYLYLQIDMCKKKSIENQSPYNYTMFDFRTYNDHIEYPSLSSRMRPFTLPNTVYRDLGLRDLQNAHQIPALSAVIVERIIDRLKSDSDIAIATAHTESYSYRIEAFMKVDVGQQEGLKAWY